MISLKDAINRAFRGFFDRTSFYGDVALSGIDEGDLKRRIREEVQSAYREHRQTRIEELQTQLREEQGYNSRNALVEREGVQGLQRELRGAHAVIAALLEEAGDSERHIPLETLDENMDRLEVGHDAEDQVTVLRVK